jgi:phosphoglycolate phosphatase
LGTLSNCTPCIGKSSRSAVIRPLSLIISCVVFDFDGTLVDSNQVKIQAFYDILKSYDPEGVFVREVLQQCVNEDRYGITRQLAQRIVAQGLVPLSTHSEEALSAQLAEAYTTTCQKKILTCPEVPGASVLLQWLLDKKIPAFINSRTPVEALNRLVELRNLSRYIARILGAPGSKLGNLRRIKEITGANPEKILFVGDSDDDMHAAAEFACHFAGVILRGTSRFGRIPPRHVKNLEELRAIVENLQEKRNVPSPPTRTF